MLEGQPGIWKEPAYLDGDPFEAAVFSSRDSLLSSIQQGSIDILSEHGRYLGQQLSSLIRGPGVNVDGLCDASLIGALRNESVVRLSTNGICGDCGMYSAAGVMLSMNSIVRQRLYDDERYYELATTSRELLRQSPKPIIGHGIPFAAGAYGFDARGFTFPFFPGCRGEGMIFGRLFRLDPMYTCFACLPSSVGHFPAEVREYTANWITTGAANIRICDVLLAMIDYVRVQSHGSLTSVIAAISAYCIMLGSLELQVFERELREIVFQYSRSQCSYMQGMLDSFRPKQAGWRKDLEERYRLALSRLSDPDLYVPIDLPQEIGRGDRIAILRQMLCRFGVLLREWSAIVEATNDVHKSGINIERLIYSRSNRSGYSAP